MKISVVTAVYNRRETIASAIKSVSSQNYANLEYVVVDGLSSDGTSGVVAEHADAINKSICEQDNGIYDALNKGIKVATGDVVGFLHADDLFADERSVCRIAEKFNSGDYDAVYGDLTYVDSANTNKIIRYWRAGSYDRKRFRFGWMPPHPTVYVRREVYEKFGGYRTDFGSAADYECMIRLLYRHELRVGYVPHIQVKMRVGGESNASIQNRLNANRSDRQSWTDNGFKPPLGLRFTKPLSKLPQYWRRPSE